MGTRAFVVAAALGATLAGARPVAVPVASAAAPRPLPRAVGNVGVVVPRFAFVRVNDAGRPIAAMTNTGAAPSAGDELVVLSTRGRIAVPDETALRQCLNSAPLDWSEPGVWHGLAFSCPWGGGRHDW